MTKDATKPALQLMEFAGVGSEKKINLGKSVQVVEGIRIGDKVK